MQGFDEGKRRLSDTEVRDLSWRDLESCCLSRTSSLYVLLYTPEAIKCRQTAACPFADSEEDCSTHSFRARRIQALRDEILLNLENRRDAAKGRIVFHVVSEQMVVLDEVSGRDWEFSFMTTHVSGDNKVDLDAFV